MRHLLVRLWPMTLLAGATSLVLSVHFAAIQADRDAPEDGYPKENYSTIEDGIFLGGILSELPKGTHAVLNVFETKDPYVAEVHRWEPIPDLGPAPDLKSLRSQVEFIDRQRKSGLPVFVHCRAGVNRSVTVVAAYLMWRDRLTRDEALKVIRVKRPRIGPFEVYKEYLLDWEKSLK